MKILHVVASAQRRGAEIFAADLIGCLTHAGTTQYAAVIKRGPAPYVTFQSKVEILDPHESGWVSVPSGRVIAHLRSCIKRWQPDVVQSHGGDPFKYSVAARFGLNVPLVYRRIGPVHDAMRSGPRRRFYRLIARQASAIVAVTSEIARETSEVFDVDGARLRVIPNGVDTQRLSTSDSPSSIRQRVGIAHDAKVILSVGALVPEKEPLDLLKAASQVLTRKEHVIYLVVGSGPLLEAMQREARIIGPKRVRLLGSRKDVPDLMHASDVLLTSGRREGLPGVALEAAMLGLPVVGYRSPALSELASAGSLFSLAETGSIEGLSVALESALDDPRPTDREAARYQELYGIGPIAQSYLELYQELVGP